MAGTRRQFHLRIWGLAFGYFAVYVPYSGLIKVVTLGLWPSSTEAVSGFQLLPATAIATAVVSPLIVSALGWWRYAGRRTIFGVDCPFPSRLVFLSGLGTAIIIATTTLAYTSTGVSILLALLLLRGGVLIMAPMIDFAFKRKVRWFSWLALAFVLAGVVVALADVDSYQMTLVAAVNIAAYLAGYLLRLPCINILAKCDDERITRRYVVEEQMVATVLLVAILAGGAAIGTGPILTELRSGFTGFFASSITLPSLLIGALYACLYFFGTLVYLDRRENTFCLPLNRCASVLSALVASYALAALFGLAPPSGAQLASAGLIIVALLVLSPLHHLPLYADNAKRSLGESAEGIAANSSLQDKPLPTVDR
jgi:hypothetical protein